MGSRGNRATPIPRDRMVKQVDAWWTVLLVDPIATRVVPPLSRLSWVTPTRITLLAHLLGVASALLFAQGHLVLAAVIFEVRFIADCIDGKVARVTGRSSRLGQLLDALGDRVLVVANLAAFGWPHAPVAVVVLAAAYPLQFQLLETRDALLGEHGGDKPSDRMMHRGWGGWLARHRMYPVPTSVDLEHLLLFGVPMAWAAGVDVVTAALWTVTAYFVLQCVRYGGSLLRVAALIDRAAAASMRV